MNFQALTGEIKRLEALIARLNARAGGAGGGQPYLVDLNGATTYTFGAPGAGGATPAGATSAQNILAAVRQTPAGGTTLSLPATPKRGQTCAFAVLDESATIARTVVLSGNGNTIASRQGAQASLTFTAPGSWAEATWDDVAGVWTLYADATSYVNTALTVAAWFINPTTGSDQNNGTTSGTPLKTWSRLAQLWGTTEPVLTQTTTITFQGAGHTDNSDPVVFRPTLRGGASAIITGTRTQLWTGTMTLVAAKNRATPATLTATLPAGAAANQLVVNTTHPSTAFIYKASGGNWVMSQPFLIPAPPFSVFGCSEVDTWATADTVTGFSLTAINIERFEPQVAENTGGTSGGYLQNCTLFDPSSGDFAYTNNSVIVSDTLTGRFLIMGTLPASTDEGGGVNVDGNPSGIIGSTGGQVVPTFFGGIVAAASGFLCLDGDAIVNAAFPVALQNSVNPSILGMVNIDVGSVTATGTVQCEAFGFSGPFIWGAAGLLNASLGGRIQYPTGANKAVATFLQHAATPLEINGVATASSHTGAQPDVYNGGVTLTAAHLDAAAGAAGFNGDAFTPGGGSISNLT